MSGRDAAGVACSGVVGGRALAGRAPARDRSMPGELLPGRHRSDRARRSARPSTRRGPTLVRALGDAATSILTDTQAPVRPAESPLLATAPRAVYQVVLPKDPDKGFIVGLRVPRHGPRRGRRGRGAGLPRRPVRAGSRRRRGRSRHPPGRARRSSSTTWLPGAAQDPSARRDPDRARDARGRASRSRTDAAPARAQPTGSGESTATQARTWARLILSVCVRGKSSSGQSRQPAIRWFGPRVALAALTAASIRSRGRPPGPCARRRPPGTCPAAPVGRAAGRPPRSGPGCVSSDDRVADAGDRAARSRCPRDRR